MHAEGLLKVIHCATALERWRSQHVAHTTLVLFECRQVALNPFQPALAVLGASFADAFQPIKAELFKLQEDPETCSHAHSSSNAGRHIGGGRPVYQELTGVQVPVVGSLTLL